MAAMRYQGRLRKWNAERDYGFIVAKDSGLDVFVHITAFPRDGRLPLQGDELTFEVEPDGNGRKQATRLQHTGGEPPAQAIPFKPGARSLSRAPKTSAFSSKLVLLVLLPALAWYGYSNYGRGVAQTKVMTQAPAPAPAALVEPAHSGPGAFNCDGRIHCAQMTSCKEAKLFLKNCPGVEMDGNHDGVPCGQQWCSSPSAD